uniref:Transposase (putative) gypsy type domain-containing protein n=1 Tax=Setaria italica TaxID=4555 RepID=K3ZD41_SETIT
MIRDFVTTGLIEDGRGRAPSSETVPFPQDNEVVIFRDLFNAGLRFPLDPIIIGILLKYKMFLHELTPNGVLRLRVFMWICKTMGVAPTVENFSGNLVKEEAQFGCLNFHYKTESSTPETSYKNRWDDDWNCFWFYHTVEVILRLVPIYLFASNFSYDKRDLVEEYCTVKIFPVKVDWAIASWKDFAKVEERANIILGPESAKEYNELEKRLDGSCSNRVFDPSPQKTKQAQEISCGSRQKHSRFEPAASTEVVESSPGESENQGTGSGPGEDERNFLDNALNVSPAHEEDVEITSPSSYHAPEDPAIPSTVSTEAIAGTASKPFEIHYCDDEPKSDDEPLLRRPQNRAPQAVVDTVVPSVACQGPFAAPEVPSTPVDETVAKEEAVSAGIMSSDLKTESDDPSSVLF